MEFSMTCQEKGEVLIQDDYLIEVTVWAGTYNLSKISILTKIIRKLNKYIVCIKEQAQEIFLTYF